MNISSIGAYYKRLLNSEEQKTSSTSDASKVASSTSSADNSALIKKISDALELSSSNSDSGFLNYTAQGTYNSESLAEALSKASTSDLMDLFGEESEDTTDYTSLLGEESSSSSDSSDVLISQAVAELVEYDNTLIKKAIERINAK